MQAEVEGASTGTEFQSRIADGKKECRCRCVCSRLGDPKLDCVPSGAAIAGLG